MRALNILVAEDNDDHAEMIIDALNGCNSDNVVHRVSNGKLLVRYLDDILQGTRPSCQLPDLIFLDVKMPVLDGLGTLKIIKKEDELKNIPVMMLSTSGSDEDVRNCYRLGANTYIVKSFDYTDFSNKIHTLNNFWANLSKFPRR